MSTEPTTSAVSHPVIKGISALVVGVGTPVAQPWYSTIEGWTQVGTLLSILAAFSYSFLLIIDWWWKRLLRPMAERRGWVKKRRSRIISVQEYETDQTTLRMSNGKDFK